MNKSIWIALIASLLVGGVSYSNEPAQSEKKKEGGCGCGKPK